MLVHHSSIRATVLCGAVVNLNGFAGAVEPLEHAHSHNDYRRERPLLDALDHGFTSVEADIFLVNDALLVGHAEVELDAQRTLESLYLDPLRRRVRENGGSVYTTGQHFYLLIDVKSDAYTTYAKLHGVLARYSEILTTVERENARPGAVTVIISGNRPQIDPAGRAPRFAGLDGRVSDLNSNAPAHLMPIISDNWSTHFAWSGSGSMPNKERAKLREIAGKTHSAGRVLRFWATPENEQVWRELRSAGVDLINTDQLARLAAYLRANNGAPLSQ